MTKFTKWALKAILVGCIFGVAIPKLVLAVPLKHGLSDPEIQPVFVEDAPNALNPGFIFQDLNEGGLLPDEPNFIVTVKATEQQTGLIDANDGITKLTTSLWGYGTDTDTATWPGKTIQVKSFSASGIKETLVRWENHLDATEHLLPVDTNLHWAYSLHGEGSRNGQDYRQYSIQNDGVPIVTHLHGGRSESQFDGKWKGGKVITYDMLLQLPSLIQHFSFNVVISMVSLQRRELH